MSDEFRISISLALGISWCLWVALLWWKKRPLTTCKAGQRLVVYASQTGQAQANAASHQTKLASAIVLPLNKITAQHLTLADEIHFHLSTYGDGEAPDNGRGFLALLNRVNHDIAAKIKFSLTAYGDSRYPKFCAFGKEVHQSLLKKGATSLSDIRLVDANNAQSTLNDPLTFADAVITEISHLNPNSKSPGLYRLTLKADQLTWQAGDLLDILPPNGQGSSIARTYSIASASSHLLDEPLMTLLVRLHITPNGKFGLTSGFLTQQCQVGSNIKVKVRTNPSCRLTTEKHPLLLIGAGSGLAGLLGHIEQRALLDNCGPIWLVYGERDPKHDEHLSTQLNTWVQNQVLQRVDKVFSRQETQKKYVQEVLLANAPMLKSFIGEHGDIYVCGSLSGMGKAVNATLKQIFGSAELNTLIQQGRYHRDLY